MTRWQKLRTLLVAHRELNRVIKSRDGWRTTANEAIAHIKTVREELDCARGEADRWQRKWAQEADLRRAVEAHLEEQELLLKALGDGHLTETGDQPTTREET